MASKTTNPRLLARSEVRECDQAGRSIYPELISPHTDHQARRLARLHALTFETAATIAGLAFAAGPR